MASGGGGGAHHGIFAQSLLFKRGFWIRCSRALSCFKAVFL
jgi:hypothetical protein